MILQLFYVRVWKIEESLVQAIRAVHDAGVLHRDMRRSNFLWNQDMKQMVLIDFERSEVVGPTRQPLSWRPCITTESSRFLKIERFCVNLICYTCTNYANVKF